ncbi:MAG TPA: riboflavin synthase [Solirubrobacteraceae bacterium]|nr:riboflavin synthase [Solirubrobacteraceae bacterium]
MFTGLIADLGRVAALERDGEGATLRIATALAGELGEGDSIAVNGVCLTAVDVVIGAPVAAAGEFAAQAIDETLRRSTLGGLAVGDAVNLELALRADGRLGGHIVQGHVDGVGTVAEIRAEGFSRVLAIDCPPDLLPCVVAKGSIALDGVSLTVSALREGGLEVSLIPETLQRTTLGAAAVGREVNVEVDILAKHVQRLLGQVGQAC